MSKTKNFYDCFHNSPSSETSLSGCTDVVNLDITDGGPAGDAGKASIVLYNFSH